MPIFTPRALDENSNKPIVKGRDGVESYKKYATLIAAAEEEIIDIDGELGEIPELFSIVEDFAYFVKTDLSLTTNNLVQKIQLDIGQKWAVELDFALTLIPDGSGTMYAYSTSSIEFASPTDVAVVVLNKDTGAATNVTFGSVVPDLANVVNNSRLSGISTKDGIYFDLEFLYNSGGSPVEERRIFKVTSTGTVESNLMGRITTTGGVPVNTGVVFASGIPILSGVTGIDSGTGKDVVTLNGGFGFATADVQATMTQRSGFIADAKPLIGDQGLCTDVDGNFVVHDTSSNVIYLSDRDGLVVTSGLGLVPDQYPASPAIFAIRPAVMRNDLLLLDFAMYRVSTGERLYRNFESPDDGLRMHSQYPLTKTTWIGEARVASGAATFLHIGISEMAAREVTSDPIAQRRGSVTWMLHKVLFRATTDSEFAIFSPHYFTPD